MSRLPHYSFFDFDGISAEAKARRKALAEFILAFRVPEPCAKALRAVDSLLEIGRISEVEAEALIDGIWPLKHRPGSPYGTTSLLQVVPEPNASSPPQAP